MTLDHTVRHGKHISHIHRLLETIGVQGTLRNLDGETDAIVPNFILRSDNTLFLNGFDDIDHSAGYWRALSKAHPSCDGL